MGCRRPPRRQQLPQNQLLRLQSQHASSRPILHPFGCRRPAGLRADACSPLLAQSLGCHLRLCVGSRCCWISAGRRFIKAPITLQLTPLSLSDCYQLLWRQRRHLVDGNACWRTPRLRMLEQALAFQCFVAMPVDRLQLRGGQACAVANGLFAFQRSPLVLMNRCQLRLCQNGHGHVATTSGMSRRSLGHKQPKELNANEDVCDCRISPPVSASVHVVCSPPSPVINM